VASTSGQQQQQQQPQQQHSEFIQQSNHRLVSGPKEDRPDIEKQVKHNRKPTTTNLDDTCEVSGGKVDSKQPENDLSSAEATKSNKAKVPDEDTYLAYIKARSFIRDKFLQITRQTDKHQQPDHRKYSSPNLPIYNHKAPSHVSTSRVDHPKRYVCYHYTTATDTENIRDLFRNLQKMFVESTMKDL